MYLDMMSGACKASLYSTEYMYRAKSGCDTLITMHTYHTVPYRKCAIVLKPPTTSSVQQKMENVWNSLVGSGYLLVSAYFIIPLLELVTILLSQISQRDRDFPNTTLYDLLAQLQSISIYVSPLHIRQSYLGSKCLL